MKKVYLHERLGKALLLSHKRTLLRLWGARFNNLCLKRDPGLFKRSPFCQQAVAACQVPTRRAHTWMLFCSQKSSEEKPLRVTCAYLLSPTLASWQQSSDRKWSIGLGPSFDPARRTRDRPWSEKRQENLFASSATVGIHRSLATASTSLLGPSKWQRVTATLAAFHREQAANYKLMKRLRFSHWSRSVFRTTMGRVTSFDHRPRARSGQLQADRGPPPLSSSTPYRTGRCAGRFRRFNRFAWLDRGQSTRSRDL